MTEPRRQRLVSLFRGARLPRRTVRLRLTLLYGGLFLASSGVLLTITYFVVRNLTGDSFIATSKKGVVSIGGVQVSGKSTLASSGAVPSGSGRITGFGGGATAPTHLTPTQMSQQAHELQQVAIASHNAELHHLLVTYGIALGVMTVVSLGLGWLVAGRILRPLRTITATTRAIGAGDLHQRLALAGPDDELKELGDTVDGLLERLESSFALQKQFVANASHELRTPLARQRALGQVALADPGATLESMRAAHERILTSGDQQEQLIDALLTLSRAQGDALKSKPIDLATLASELVQARVHEAEARGIRLTDDLQSVELLGDPRLVERLAANLLDNALRHNAPGGSVSVSTWAHGGSARLRIANDGPVVLPEDVERLYEPFERLDGERPSNAEGFGLGLCIVKAVATAHGATIETEARPTGGLRVEVRFPELSPV